MTVSTNIIWISSKENNDKIKKYLKELEDLKYYKINLIFSIEEVIDRIKTIRFEETIIIVEGNFYIKFIEEFQKNILNFFIIPKIVIFTENKEEFINKNLEYTKVINELFLIKINLN